MSGLLVAGYSHNLYKRPDCYSLSRIFLYSAIANITGACAANSAGGISPKSCLNHIWRGGGTPLSHRHPLIRSHLGELHLRMCTFAKVRSSHVCLNVHKGTRFAPISAPLHRCETVRSFASTVVSPQPMRSFLLQTEDKTRKFGNHPKCEHL